MSADAAAQQVQNIGFGDWRDLAVVLLVIGLGPALLCAGYWLSAPFAKHSRMGLRRADQQSAVSVYGIERR